MIVDTSALVAILLVEPEQPRFTAALSQARSAKVSAATYVEASIVLDARRDPEISRSLDQLLEEFGVDVVPLTSGQASIARRAYRDYGTGSGHPAQLNFGDCFSYALAIDAKDTLLFKGDDFTHTDVRPAL